MQQALGYAETLDIPFVYSSNGVTFNDPINIKIRFSLGQAKYIRKRRWTKKQKISDSTDGSIILEMDTSGWWEVMRWVLSFGADAEVLEPQELREEIELAIHKLAQIYLPTSQSSLCNYEVA